MEADKYQKNHLLVNEKRRCLCRDQNQASFYPFVLHEISVLTELALGHLCYCLTDVPPQPNSPPDAAFDSDRPPGGGPSMAKCFSKKYGNKG